MSSDEQPDNHQYDAHRLIFHMSLAGVLFCAGGLLVSLVSVYRDIGFDIINLRIDKLGDYLHSPYAYVYNIGLMFSGASFMLGMLGLYLLNYNHFSHYLSIAGCCSGIGISLLGIFPYNDVAAHKGAALFFIVSTFSMFILLIITRRRSPILCNRPLFIISILGVILSLALLAQMDTSTLDYVQCDPDTLCPSAISIWLHTFMTMGAGIGLALTARALANSPHHPMTNTEKTPPLRLR